MTGYHDNNHTSLMVADDDDLDELPNHYNGRAPTLIINRQSSSSNVAVWKALSIILLGIILLFATDSIELKRAIVDGDTYVADTNTKQHVKNNKQKNVLVKSNSKVDSSTSIEPSSSTSTISNLITNDEDLIPSTVESGIAISDDSIASDDAGKNNDKSSQNDAPSDVVVQTQEVEKVLDNNSKIPDANKDTTDRPQTAAGEVDKESTPTPVADEKENPNVVEPQPAVEAEISKSVTGSSSSTTKITKLDGATTDDDKDKTIGTTERQRRTYKRRGQPLTDEERQSMINEWGSWALVDEKKDIRPSDDYYAKYSNRDIPRSEFPSNAWQTDKEYLDKFIPESLSLVERALKAIWLEYGHSYPDSPAGQKLFVPEFVQPFNDTTVDDHVQVGRRGKIDRPSLRWAGWTNEQSWNGLKRRLLHAVMTEDSFIFAMGGHSAAAGHGNTFTQSYTLQVQWVLEAVFARLGVRHESRNFGNGGLGTIQHGLAAASVFGPDVDMLMWDSGMTEGEEHAKEVIFIQAALSGSKVPVYWSLAGNAAKLLHLKADVDVGYFGDGIEAMPLGESLEEIGKMPWAVQYVHCSDEMHQICRENEYNAECWVERDDFSPPKTQVKMGGRANWHPGNRIHQIRGRIIASQILQALKDALTDWKEAPNYELPDSAWHVTAMYDNVRNKLKALGPEDGSCQSGLAAFDMEWTCKYPAKARTEFTPRAYPSIASLRSIMPEAQRKEINDPPAPVYMPPDVFNPSLHPPKGAVDVLNIVEAGVDFSSILNPDYHSNYYKVPKFRTEPMKTPGKGFMLDTYPGDEYCDGSVDSWCNKGKDNDCLLYGHNDGRNGISMDGYSGWMVMNIPDLRYGFISIKFETWHWPKEQTKTEGWTTENNAGSRSLVRRSLGPSPPEIDASWQTYDERILKEAVTEYCPEFRFEYSIDGKVEGSLNLEEWEAKRKQPARVVETVTILKDPNFVTNNEEIEVQVAFRLTGCGKVKVFKVSHVYWA